MTVPEPAERLRHTPSALQPALGATTLVHLPIKLRFIRAQAGPPRAAAACQHYWVQDADPDLVLLDPCSAEVWFAGKRLRPGSKLAERMGRNEKTKAVVRLMPAGHGAPPREQVSCWCACVAGAACITGHGMIGGACGIPSKC